MSQIAGVAALVAAGFIIVSITHGSNNDDRVERLLSSPSQVEQFKAIGHDSAKTANDRTSPLVKQAEIFALHLNPKPKTQKPALSKVKVARSGISSVKPNFKVLGTSFLKGNPEMSLVLIDEPGKGRHWSRQSDRVGEFLIEQIQDGSVVVKNGENTFELVLERGPKKSSTKEAAPLYARAVDQSHEGYSLPIPGKDSSITPKTAGEVSTATKYDILEPMWGEDGLSAQVLSYASSPK